MTKEEIFGKIKEIMISEFEIEAEQITPEAKLVADLDLDSIDAVDLIVKMKQYTSRGKLEAELFKNAKTVQDVVNILAPLV